MPAAGAACAWASAGAASAAAARAARWLLKTDARGPMNSGMPQINGRIMRCMVDTGASTVAMAGDAQHARYLKFMRQQGLTRRADEHRQRAWPGAGVRARFGLRVGDVELRDVDAIVTPSPCPAVLLGSNFPARIRMSRNGDKWCCSSGAEPPCETPAHDHTVTRQRPCGYGR